MMTDDDRPPLFEEPFAQTLSGILIERLEMLQVKRLLAHAGYVKNASPDITRNYPTYARTSKVCFADMETHCSEKNWLTTCKKTCNRQGCMVAEEQTLPPEVLGRT